MKKLLLKIKEYLIIYKIYILFFIVAILLILLFCYVYYCFNLNDVVSNSDINSISDELSEVKISDANNDISEYIYVDIKGHVNKPGVYKLSINSRVIDLVNESGGLKKDANTRFINLSKKLNDGDVVVIYSNKEINDAKKNNIIYVDTPCVCEEVKNDACYDIKEGNTLININLSSLEELMNLEGIGESKAKAIIEYRNNNGKFNKIEDIINVSGISETIFNKIKENITV